MTQDHQLDIDANYYGHSGIKKLAELARYAREQLFAAAERTKSIGTSAATTTKNMAIATTSIGVGAAVLSTELSLAAVVTSAHIARDMLYKSKQMSVDTLRAVNEKERQVQAAVIQAFVNGEHRVGSALRTTVAGTKLVDNTNAVLDVLNTLVDRFVVNGTKIETMDVDEDDDVGYTLSGRVYKLGNKVTQALSAKAQDHVFSPVANSMKNAVDELRKSLLTMKAGEKKVETAMHRVYVRGENGVNTVLRASSDRLAENTNAVLDLLNTLADRFIINGHATQIELPDDDDTSRTVSGRVYKLGNKVASGLSAKAQVQVFTPLAHAVDELRKSLVGPTKN